MWMNDIYLSRTSDDLYLTTILENRIEATIVQFMRMSKVDFDFLLSMIGPRIARQTTHMREPVEPRVRLAIALKYLATGESYTSLNFFFKMPSTMDEWFQVSNRFESKWNFPHAIGAIDGKHVRIQAPRNSGSEYFNYKHFFSIILMAIVDADYNFLYADVGCQGRMSDGGVWKHTKMYRKFENNSLNIPEPEILRIPYKTKIPYMLLGDKAFASTSYCIRPYTGTPPEGSVKRIFNKRHARARRTVENAFGILNNVFGVYSRPMKQAPEVARKVVLATICLHNFLRKRESRNTYSPPELTDRVVQGRIINGSWRTDNGATTMQNLPQLPLRTSRELLAVRDHIANDFVMNNQINRS
uniref:DDE Tnp4 domain-containing protein n=1 Tax=Anopheles dirus TaxID=7168 RepID=A0A182NVP4_9DIPT